MGLFYDTVFKLWKQTKAPENSSGAFVKMKRIDATNK
mgnify:CR=1 FL=1